jgi:hypothetical protein
MTSKGRAGKFGRFGKIVITVATHTFGEFVIAGPNSFR